MRQKFKYFLNKGNQRTILAKKNIILSFTLKLVGMLTMFTLISISIKYLGNMNYGVWITISGIIAWAGMFDFGFSHGLRNRLTESLAQDDYITGRFLVSSTYLFMIFIAILLIALFYPIIYMVNWQSLLNLPDDYNLEILFESIQIIFFFFIIQFSLKPINAVLQAYQWPAISQSLGTIGGVVTVLFVGLLYYLHISPKLLYYAIIVAGVPIIISLIATIYLFRQKFRSLIPSFKFLKVHYLKSIGGLGLAFFIIQLSLLVIYSSDNLIISYLFGPEEVTTYNVVYRYFSIITIFFGVVMTPFWSAITDAYAKEEMKWIQKTIRALLFVLLGGTIISFILYLIGPWVFSWWIADDFSAPWLLIGLMGVYAIAMGWQNIFSFFSNGIGKIRVQMISYVIAAIANLPLSYYFGKILNMGSSGVLVASILCTSFVSVILTVQYKKVMSGRAKGIWNK